MRNLVGLYVITDPNLTPYEDDLILRKVTSALKGGAKLVQLRDKKKKDNELVKIALEIKRICHEHDALFIVNDRIELAKVVDADGVHLGSEDLPLEIARRELSNKIIGISCYEDLERALEAQRKGADYVAFGSFFPSPTKPQSKVVSLEILKEAKKLLSIPICAIGGITINRAEELIKLGAHMIAVISDIWLAPDIEKRAKEYEILFKKYYPS